MIYCKFYCSIHHCVVHLNVDIQFVQLGWLFCQECEIWTIFAIMQMNVQQIFTQNTSKERKILPFLTSETMYLVASHMDRQWIQALRFHTLIRALIAKIILRKHYEWYDDPLTSLFIWRALSIILLLVVGVATFGSPPWAFFDKMADLATTEKFYIKEVVLYK